MASDLIPPPSPAGKPPSPDGVGIPNLIELPPETPLGATDSGPAGPPPGPSEFRNRFGFLLGALAGVFIAAALVAVIVISSNSGDAAADEGLAANWSRWQPPDNSIEKGAKEIAAHVGPEYKHPDGKQLVDITGGELPSDYKLIVRPTAGPLATIDGTRVIYQLDGLGSNPPGSIKGGTPSASRLKVVQREALELALYTFRYLPDAESVMVLLPPPPQTAEQQAAAAAAAAAPSSTTSAPADTSIPAIFYRPGDLRQQLQVPLGNTLGPKAPSTDAFSGREADTVATLTLSNTFNMTSQGSTILLDRP